MLSVYHLPKSNSREFEPTAGFEPATYCLRNSCSTTELCRLILIMQEQSKLPPKMRTNKRELKEVKLMPLS